MDIDSSFDQTLDQNDHNYVAMNQRISGGSRRYQSEYTTQNDFFFAISPRILAHSPRDAFHSFKAA
jgi:hypothetical protein